MHKGRCNSFPWIAPPTLDQYLVILSVKQGSIKYHFLSLWYDSNWGWTQSPRPLANTQTIMQMGWLIVELKKKKKVRYEPFYRPLLGVKCCFSTRMTLALSKPPRLSNKETKPNEIQTPLPGFELRSSGSIPMMIIVGKHVPP